MADKLNGLTGLRIFAAVWVTLYHFRDITPEHVWKFPLIDPFILRGFYGVDLFFVLSGFILSHVYFTTFKDRVQKKDAWSFISFRFARLYPLHLVTFLMLLGLYLAEQVISGSSTATESRYEWQNIIATLTLTQAWFPGAEQPNLPAWSISAEWFAYLFFPLLCILMARLRRGGALAFLLLGLAFCVLYAFAPSDLGRIAAAFPIGMAAYQIANRVHGWIGRLPFLGIVITAAIVIWSISSQEPRMEIGLLLFGALVIALSSRTDWAARFLGTRFLVYLGEVSYAVYMFHWVARILVRDGSARLGLDFSDPVMILLNLVVTFAGAILLYHFVEKPSRGWLRRLFTSMSTRRPKPPLDAPTTA